MELQFENPGYLIGLAIIPLLWIYVDCKSFAALGRRAVFAAVFRSLTIAAIIVSIAGIRFQFSTDRTSVVYVLDQSDSIERTTRARMLDLVTQHANQFRKQSRGDIVGVVSFSGDATISVPPYPGDLPPLKTVGMEVANADATNIEEAIALARAALPVATRRRIVIVTDGNQTRGRFEKAVQHAAAAGIGIDVVPVTPPKAADVVLERVDIPANIRTGQSFEGRVVMTFNAPPETNPQQEVLSGNLSITLKTAGNETFIANSKVDVTAGTNVFPFRYKIDTPAAYTVNARFVPTSNRDAYALNNEGSAFALVSGNSRALLIEPWNDRGNHQQLVEQLEESEIQVDVQASNRTFSTLTDLLNYDLVILANLPRTSGEEADQLVSFTDKQLELLDRNTRQFGAGLLMVGGPEAFGAGGWTGSSLEKAMPVDFDVKNTKVNAVGALMVVIDSSGSMSGEKIELCKAAAKEAIRSLRQEDYVGVITFDSETKEIIPLQKVAKRTHIIPRVSRIAAGGGTDMYPAMQRGFQRLSKADAMVKHMIVLSDGQTPANRFSELVAEMHRSGITVTTVAIGDDADGALMNKIATGGAGKYYKVISPKAIPNIVMRESRRVAKPLIYESPDGITPRWTASHSITQGLERIPVFTGFVLTTSKDNSLVQNLITASEPQDIEHPILSVWQYGLGRSAVWTTDTGQRWTGNWNEWPEQQQLFSQLARWLMRPRGNSSNYQVTTMVEGEQVNVVVNALTDAGEYDDFRNIQASVLGPSFDSADLQLKQTGPGRYQGSFPATQAGIYYVNVAPDAESGSIVSGVAVPHGKEFRKLSTDWSTIELMASAIPDDGLRGEVLPSLDQWQDSQSLVDPFRGGLTSQQVLQDAWPWVVLIGCGLFLADVTIRRVNLDILGVLRRFRGGESNTAPDVRLTSLDQLAKTKRRLSAEVHPAAAQVERDGDENPILSGHAKEPKRVQSLNSDAGSTQEADYIQRLRAAKKEARKD